MWYTIKLNILPFLFTMRERESGATLIRKELPFLGNYSFWILPSVDPSIRFVRNVFTEEIRHLRLTGGDYDPTILIASELASNAVKYGKQRGISQRMPQEFVAGVARRNGQALVFFGDSNPQYPVLVHAENNSEGQRGMWLVEELSEQWGSTRDIPPIIRGCAPNLRKLTWSIPKVY